jgi:hypothetical protein
MLIARLRYSIANAQKPERIIDMIGNKKKHTELRLSTNQAELGRSGRLFSINSKWSKPWFSEKKRIG